MSGFILIALGWYRKCPLSWLPFRPLYWWCWHRDVWHGAGYRNQGVITVDFQNRYNLYIVAISLGMGMIPTVAKDFFGQMPEWHRFYTAVSCWQV
jgi:hypothetical protein